MCLVFILSGFPVVLDVVSNFAPAIIVETISSFSFLTHFTAISRGVIDAKDVIFFASLIAFWLFANAIFIDLKKGE